MHGIIRGTCPTYPPAPSHPKPLLTHPSLPSIPHFHPIAHHLLHHRFPANLSISNVILLWYHTSLITELCSPLSCPIPYLGLRHPQLFRNVFHQPSVEASLSMFANPRKNHLFSVKMMRIDTVAGLLTTALSRTYPPLIPVHIQDMFQNPNGKNEIGSMLFFPKQRGERVAYTAMHPHPRKKVAPEFEFRPGGLCLCYTAFLCSLTHLSLP